jgi:hypothetical protein
MKRGSKRARTEDNGMPSTETPSVGREQLLITSAHLQKRLGKKFCDESEVLPLLFERGVLRRVKTIEVEVRHCDPTKGSSYGVTLDAAKPRVSEVKAEIARMQGLPVAQQDIHKLAARYGPDICESAGGEILEELLDIGTVVDGDIFEVGQKEQPLIWRTYDELYVTLSEGNALATRVVGGNEQVLVTSGVQMKQGRHYWEVGFVSQRLVSHINIGVSRPNLDPNEDHAVGQSSNGWFICPQDGSLWGNGKFNDDTAGEYKKGDRVGVLLDLEDGSLLFFKNGVQHGAGYPAGSVSGPVVHAMQMYCADDGGRLLAEAHWPASHALRSAS